MTIFGKHQDNDDEIYAKEAYDHNMSVEDYKRSLEKEREIKALSQKVKENEEREQKRAWIQELRAQVPQVQKIFPSFDLDEEMKTPILHIWSGPVRLPLLKTQCMRCIIEKFFPEQ